MITPDTYFARLGGLASDGLRDKTVIVVGVGGGSFFADKLARAVAEVRIVDRDEVELPNLHRQAFTTDDIGHPKALAVAERASRANPLCRAVAVVADVLELDRDAQDELVAGADVLVAGTDSFAAQAALNVLSQRCGIPAVFVGIHDRGEGGRIVWTVPGETPCLRCVSGRRYAAHDQAGDASAVDLPGAAALLADIQIVDAVALKVVLALLERGQESALGRFHAWMAGRGNEIVVRTGPDHAWLAGLWNAFLADVPPTDIALGDCLLGIDALCLPTTARPDCPDCGGRERVPGLAVL